MVPFRLSETHESLLLGTFRGKLCGSVCCYYFRQVGSRAERYAIPVAYLAISVRVLDIWNREKGWWDSGTVVFVCRGNWVSLIEDEGLVLMLILGYE